MLNENELFKKRNNNCIWYNLNFDYIRILNHIVALTSNFYILHIRIKLVIYMITNVVDFHDHSKVG